jgi:SagB-type dehydrogenase family enzyme
MISHHWERNALAFHRKSRQPGFQPNKSQKSLAEYAARSVVAIPLERLSRCEGREFSEVLDSRRSSRAWPNRPISLNTFAQFLWMSARNRDFGPTGLETGFVDRPYPSGGAAYSLELYPIISPNAVESIKAGIYRYLPDSHGLEPLSVETANYVPFLEAAGRSAGSRSPPLVIVITSRFVKQSETYGDIAYSLVLKEVGALFQTLYLVAEYLDLAACALGGGTPDQLFAQLRGTTDLTEPVVGEFMLGPR